MRVTISLRRDAQEKVTITEHFGNPATPTFPTAITVEGVVAVHVNDVLLAVEDSNSPWWRRLLKAVAQR